jgi:hypothetical protein
LAPKGAESSAEADEQASTINLDESDRRTKELNRRAVALLHFESELSNPRRGEIDASGEP